MIRIPLRRTAALALTLPLLAGLSACKDDAREAPSAEAAKGAELLPRSVDDSMPAYDQRRSQAPLAEPEAAGTDGSSAPANGAGGGEETATDETPAEADAAPAPSSEENAPTP